jgi:hypothetical protein
MSSEIILFKGKNFWELVLGVEEEEICIIID